MSMRTTKAQRDAWSDHAHRLMVQVNPNELVLSAAHTLDLLADLDDALAPSSRTFDAGLRKAAEIARNFGDLYCHDSPCPTCEHIAQSILAELTGAPQPLYHEDGRKRGTTPIHVKPGQTLQNAFADAAPQESINAEMLRVLGDIKVADLGSDENARWYVGVQTDRGCCSLRIEEPSAIEMFAEWKKSRDAIIAKASEGVELGRQEGEGR